MVKAFKVQEARMRAQQYQERMKAHQSILYYQDIEMILMHTTTKQLVSETRDGSL